MKILYINNSRIPTEKAHGIQIMKMCESFSSAGVCLELILPTRVNKKFKKINIFKYYSVKQNFIIKKIFSFDPYWLIKLPQGIYIKFQIIFFIISLFFYLLFKRNKSKYIFYTRDEYLLPVLQLFSKKVVWESHALPKHTKRYLKYWQRCFKIIVLTHSLKNKLINLGIQKNKILVNPSGVDLKIFDIKISKNEARQQLDLPQNKIIFGYTGSFKTKNMAKGINDILKALKKLLQHRADILFVAVGGSEKDIKYYNNKAKEIGVLKNILLLLPVNQEKLAIYQKAFDILLMPFPGKEHYKYFMSPLKMFEYMVSSRPIITSDLPAIREVLNNNNAVFFKSNDFYDLSEKIKLVLQDKTLSNRISKQALLEVQNYTWRKRTQKIINFLS